MTTEDPVVRRKVLRVLSNVIMIVLLTFITQIGGVAWLIAARFRLRLLSFVVAYLALSLASVPLASAFGRVPLPCGGDESLRMQSWFYCVLNRQYVTAGLSVTASDLARHMASEFPGTITLALDGNFPFFDSFPLLPHLSHDDGRKLDLAFYYARNGSYLPGEVRSPIGYFAFEPGPTECPLNWATLRWDLNWLQPVMKDLDVDADRLRAALEWLAQDPRVVKVFLEPHLRERFDVASPKFRFQGCRAARHDDHIHFEV